MRTSIFVFLAVVICGCAIELPPTTDNINKIFESKDFTFAFINSEGNEKSLSFVNDYLVYKSEAPTYRREVTYQEVVLINRFIQELLDDHQNDITSDKSAYYKVYSTAYKIRMYPKQLGEERFMELLSFLKLVD